LEKQKNYNISKRENSCMFLGVAVTSQKLGAGGRGEMGKGFRYLGHCRKKKHKVGYSPCLAGGSPRRPFVGKGEKAFTREKTGKGKRRKGRHW